MKKFLSLAMLLGSMTFMAFSAEAKTGEANTFSKGSATAEYSVQPGRWRRTRVTTTVRTVRRGRFVYRETTRVTRYPNGRVVRQVISRVRVR